MIGYPSCQSVTCWLLYTYASQNVSDNLNLPNRLECHKQIENKFCLASSHWISLSTFLGTTKAFPDKKQLKLAGQYLSTGSDTITPSLKRAERDGPGGRTINKCIRKRAPFRRFSTLHVRDFHRTSTFCRLKAFPFTFWCISFSLYEWAEHMNFLARIRMGSARLPTNSLIRWMRKDTLSVLRKVSMSISYELRHVVLFQQE